MENNKILTNEQIDKETNKQLIEDMKNAKSRIRILEEQVSLLLEKLSKASI